VATFQLHRVSQERVRLEPSASTDVSFLVTNTTPVMQAAHLSLKFSTDTPPDWISLDARVRELPASGSESVSIRVDGRGASPSELTFWLIAARASAPDDDWAQSPPVTVEIPKVEPKKVPRWVWILLIALGAAALIGTAIALIVILTQKAELLEACEDDGDCKRDLQCSARPPDTALRCRAERLQSCSSPEACVLGTQCVNEVCRGENGSTCEEDSHCVSSLCAQGQCRNVPGLFEACAPDGRCGRGTTCAQVANVRVCLLVNGQSCTSASQCQSQQCTRGSCGGFSLPGPDIFLPPDIDIVIRDPGVRLDPSITAPVPGRP